MEFALIDSSLKLEKLVEKARNLDILLIKPTEEDKIKLAYELTKRSFARKDNIARDFKLEMLLWLSKKTDIKSAIKEAEPRNKQEIMLVILSGNTKDILKQLHAIEKKPKKTKESSGLELEEIALSRIMK